MTREAEWVPVSKVKKKDWIIDPNCGQPGCVKSVEVVGEFVEIKWIVGPPGRMGFRAKVGQEICRFRKVKNGKNSAGTNRL